MGTVALLDPPVLEPGQHGRVQLVLREPVGAWHGDRVVLRDAAASRTLAGGRVLDPLAPVRYRRTPQRLSELDALALPDLTQRLAALVAVAPHGLDLQRFEASQGEPLNDAVHALNADTLRQRDAHGDHLLNGTHAAAAGVRVLEALAQYHQSHPEELGPDSARLRRLALPRLLEPLWRALLARLLASEAVHLRGACVHLPEHGVRLSANEERLAQRVAGPLLEVGFEGAWVRDLARDIAEPEALVRVTLARLAQRGELHQVVKDLYCPPATMARLAAIVRELAGSHGGAVLAATFRDATQLGRKRAIQILEYFDRIGLLRRVDDVHWLRADCQLFAEAVA
jgi:selenocysteine-specific elongation factor